MSSTRLQGRVAIVTGAAQGIGAAYARALAAAGASVCVADVLDCDAVVKDIGAAGGAAIAVHCDVTSAASARDMVAATLAAFGQLDILVNNAGLFASLALKRFTDIDSDEWDKVMAVNVRGVFECTKAAAAAMKLRGYGKVINIASGTVFKGSPMLLHYVTSKGAVVAMSRCLARELGEDGIRVGVRSCGNRVRGGVGVRASSLRLALCDGCPAHLGLLWCWPAAPASCGCGRSSHSPTRYSPPMMSSA
jgi:NAD(P)-dependent dehydrogenase (short-subunit alcohol dehydrogenase family)